LGASHRKSRPDAGKARQAQSGDGQGPREAESHEKGRQQKAALALFAADAPDRRDFSVLVQGPGLPGGLHLGQVLLDIRGEELAAKFETAILAVPFQRIDFAGLAATLDDEPERILGALRRMAQGNRNMSPSRATTSLRSRVTASISLSVTPPRS
jgi:hypothetical protein